MVVYSCGSVTYTFRLGVKRFLRNSRQKRVCLSSPALTRYFDSIQSSGLERQNRFF